MLKQTADGIKQMAEYGDNIDKMSQKMGMSAEKYQEWDFVMQHNGTTIEGLQSAMKTMATQAESDSKAFEELGFTQEQLNSMSQEELFSATITALQGVEDETKRTYLASKTLGKGATELGALLNMTADETAEMKQQAHDLGGVLSDEAVKAAAEYQDSLQNLETSIGGFTNGIMSQFLPDVTDMMDGLTKVFNGDDSGLEQINKGIDSFVSHFSENMPKIFDAAQQIIGKILQAITDNLPKIFEAAMPIIMQLINGIMDALPSLLEAAGQIIRQICDGLAAALPDMIPAIVDIIVNIVETLIENAPMLIEASITLITSLAEGLINALPTLIEKGPEIVIALLKAIITAAPKLLEAGLQLILSLAKGIVNAVGNLISVLPDIVKKIINFFKETDWASIGLNIIKGIGKGLLNAVGELFNVVKELVGNIFGWFKKLLGINSPSKKFKWIGEMCVAGFEEPMEDMDMDPFTENVTASLSSVTSGIAGANYENSGSFYGNVNSNVQVVLEGDAAGVFRLVKTENQKNVKSLGYSPLMA